MLFEADNRLYAEYIHAREHEDDFVEVVDTLSFRQDDDLNDIQPAEEVDPEELQLEDFIDTSSDQQVVIDYDEVLRQTTGPQFTALNQEPAAVDVDQEDDEEFCQVTIDDQAIQVGALDPVDPVPKGYTAFRQMQPQVLDKDGKPVKKLGRPFGWRKAIHGKEATLGRAATGKSPVSTESKAPVSMDDRKSRRSISQLPVGNLFDERCQPANGATMKSAEVVKGEEHIGSADTEPLIKQEIRVDDAEETPVAIGYAAFRQAQVGSDGKPVKKLGRPLGWRKSIHGRAKALQHKVDTGAEKSESGLIDEIMASTIGRDVKFEVEQVTGIQDAPANTFELSEEVENFELPEEEFSRADGPSGLTVVPEMVEIETIEDEDSEERIMSLNLWAGVIEYASMPMKSQSSAHKLSGTVDRRDSVIGDLAQSEMPHENDTLRTKGDASAATDTQAEQPYWSAIDRVFSTYELIERVLLSMTTSTKHEEKSAIKTVLLAQRVNKNFQHVIQRSLELQQMLFFKTLPTAAKKDNKDVELRFNPLFQTVMDIRRFIELRRMDAAHILHEGVVKLAFEVPQAKAWRSREVQDAASFQQSWTRMLICHGAPAGHLTESFVWDDNWVFSSSMCSPLGRNATLGDLWNSMRSAWTKKSQHSHLPRA